MTENTWQGGPATIKVTNTFDHPMVYTLHSAVKRNLIQASGFTDEKFTLNPGEVKSHTVNFKPINGQPLPLNKARVSFNVNAEMNRPGEESIEVYNNFKLSIKTNK